MPYKNFWRSDMSTLSIQIHPADGVEIDDQSQFLVHLAPEFFHQMMHPKSWLSTPNSLYFPCPTSPSYKSNAMPPAIVIGKLLKYCCWSWSNLASAVPSTSPAGLQRLGCFWNRPPAKLPMMPAKNNLTKWKFNRIDFPCAWKQFSTCWDATLWSIPWNTWT